MSRIDWLKDQLAALQAEQQWLEQQIAAEQPPEPNPGQSAVWSDLIVQRLAINTHINWRSDIWGTDPRWRDAFHDLGLRNTRSMLGSNKATMEDLKYIEANLICLMSDGKDYGRNWQADIDLAKTNPSQILAFEGPNEPNNTANPNHATWVDDTVNFQTDLYDAIDEQWTAQGIGMRSVLGPSIWKRIKADYQALGDISAVLDIGNLHYYTGGRKPTESTEGDDSTSGGLDAALADAHIIAPNEMLWMTEVGWPVGGPGCPLGAGFVTVKAQAKYILRMICENYLRGVEMTAIYTLMDDNRSPPRYHGLMDRNMAKRMAFGSLKRFAAHYADPGSEPQPQTMEYQITAPGDVKALPLMAKRDSTLMWTLWRDLDSYDRTTFRDIDPPPVQATIEIGQSRNFQVYEPTLGGSLIKSGAGTSIAVDVADHVVIVKAA